VQYGALSGRELVPHVENWVNQYFTALQVVERMAEGTMKSGDSDSDGEDDDDEEGVSVGMLLKGRQYRMAAFNGGMNIRPHKLLAADDWMRRSAEADTDPETEEGVGGDDVDGVDIDELWMWAMGKGDMDTSSAGNDVVGDYIDVAVANMAHRIQKADGEVKDAEDEAKRKGGIQNKEEAEKGRFDFSPPTVDGSTGFDFGSPSRGADGSAMPVFSFGSKEAVERGREQAEDQAEKEVEERVREHDQDSKVHEDEGDAMVTDLAVPDGCPWLQKAVDRWGLQPPYVVHTARQWRSYYEERAALEWRHESVWDRAGEELSAEATAAKWAEARAAFTDLDEEPQCKMRPICVESYAEYNNTTTRLDYKKTTTRSQYEGFINGVRHSIQTAISPTRLSGEEGAGAGNGGAGGKSRNAKKKKRKKKKKKKKKGVGAAVALEEQQEQQEDLEMDNRGDTPSGDANAGDEDSMQMEVLAKAAAAGCFILQYWVNYELSGRVRSAEFETRLYAPVGTGASFDFYYRYHFRERSASQRSAHGFCHPPLERYLNGYSIDRNIASACAANPTAPMSSWKPSQRSFTLPREPDSWRVFNQSDESNNGVILTAEDVPVYPLAAELTALGVTRVYNESSLATESSLPSFTERLLGRGAQAIPELQAFQLAVGASGAGTAGETTSWLTQRGEEQYGEGEAEDQMKKEAKKEAEERAREHAGLAGAQQRQDSNRVETQGATAASTDGHSSAPVLTWSKEMVVEWLGSIGGVYVQYGAAFLFEGINGEELLEISAAELLEFGVSNQRHQKRILKEVARLRAS
jgi:hypothetical protein